MKKNYLIILLAPIITSSTLFPGSIYSQDLTGEQRKERCQNNKNRIAELETELKVVNAQFPGTMTQKEMEDTRSQMVFVRSMKVKPEQIHPDNHVKLAKIAGQHGFEYGNCLRSYDDFVKRCIVPLENIIAGKIDKAKTLNRQEILTKKNEIEKQLASHRNRLIEFGCDQISETFADNYSKATISSSGNSFSGSWTYTINDSKGTGSFSNCKVVGNTVTGNWTVQHEDNTKTGTRKGTFTATLSGDTFSGELLEDTPAWNYKTGYNKDNVQSRMRKGEKWPFSWKRQ